MTNKIYTYNNIVTRAGYLVVCCWGALILCLLCARISTGLNTLHAKLRGLS